MARQAIAPAFLYPVYVNETTSNDVITAGSVYINETIPPPAPPPPAGPAPVIAYMMQ